MDKERQIEEYQEDVLKPGEKIDLEGILETDNVAELLSDQARDHIAHQVVEGFEADKNSRQSWEDACELAYEVVKTTREQKNEPWEGASNIKYPLALQATLQFYARARKNIIQADRRVCYGKVLKYGTQFQDDPQFEQMAKQVATKRADFLNYQLMNLIHGWRTSLKSVLVDVGLVGSAFKKIFYDPKLKNPSSQYVATKNLVFDYDLDDFEKAIRVTHEYRLTLNEIVEEVRSGNFLRHDLGVGDVDTEGEGYKPHFDHDYDYLEQLLWIDLDNDGYAEPYIAYVTKTAKQLSCLKKRFNENSILYNSDEEIQKINPKRYYVQYNGFPSLDGSCLGLGMGFLLSHVNDVINSGMNALMDSAKANNMSGGVYMHGRVTPLFGQSINMQHNSWQPVRLTGIDDIRKAFMEYPVKPPDPTLMNLISVLIESGEKTASISDVLMGNLPRGNVPVGTIMTAVEQGMELSNSIHEDVFDSLGKEITMTDEVNQENIDDEVEFEIYGQGFDTITPSEFEADYVSIHPVADPRQLTDQQKRLSAEQLNGMRGMGLNDMEINRFVLETLPGVDDPSRFIPEQPQPNPEAEKMYAELDHKKQELELNQRQFMLEVDKFKVDRIKTLAEVQKIKMEALKAVADAESAEEGNQIEQYKAFANQSDNISKMLMEIGDMASDEQPQPDNEPGPAPANR